ncbi:MAG: amylo-alpha-1,6-glucosidase, partial [bacterium]|nr:amylo-alpha-1,6-glucosidase [bacterium]
ALSLPFDDLLHVKTKSYILDRVKEKLLTPFGLRTLSVDSPSYIRSYSGKQPESAYNGIIHPYLLSHYTTAYLKLNHYSKQARDDVKYLLLNFEKMIKEDIIGFFPQYVNSLPPYSPAGLPDHSLTFASYIQIRTKELDSF